MAARGSDRIVDVARGAARRAARPGCAAAARSCRSRRSARVRSLVDELNLVTRDDLDELELRVAQLEHRLRLLERSRLQPLP